MSDSEITIVGIVLSFLAGALIDVIRRAVWKRLLRQPWLSYFGQRGGSELMRNSV